VKLVKPTEMYTYSFGWKEFKTVGVSPIRQFIETLQDVSLNDVDVFRAITDQEIVHTMRAFDTKRDNCNNRGNFYAKKCY